VEYTVVSQDGNSSKIYRVTVTAAPNNAKEISAFSFDGIDTSSIISAGPNAAGKYPIVVTVPQSTVLSSLIPRITHTGVSITGLGVALSTTATVLGSASNFSNAYISASLVVPAEYTVTAQDGTAKTYAVTVRTTDPADDPRITGFYFTDPLAVGAIDQDSNTITLRVPSNTNRNGLKPTVYFSGASVSPGSGGAVNFTGPVTYTVTGFSGKTRSYVVTVAATPSSAKDITRFKFPGIPNGETVIGAVPNSDGTYPISVWVPAGTPLGNLAPDIAYTGGSITPAGGKPLNFNGPQTFTVTAEDVSAKTYTVTVGTHSGATKLISSLVFEEVPLSAGSPVRAAAAVDQSAYTITAEVPYTADLTNLAPTLTYIGRSVAGPSGGDRTANPFTDTGRNFTGDQIYTVKDQAGASQSYTVRVIRRSSVRVDFTGDRDTAVIKSNALDQSTGVIKFEVNTANVDPPYDWYLDGVKQGASGATFNLVVGDGSLAPGRHEVMVSGKKNGLHYTGKSSFTVSGVGS
jgi:hypothetical protein